MFISFISFHFNIIAHMFLYCGLYCFSKFQPSADGFSSPRLKAGASKPLFGEGIMVAVDLGDGEPLAVNPALVQTGTQKPEAQQLAAEQFTNPSSIFLIVQDTVDSLTS